jgi:hypothetical protein
MWGFVCPVQAAAHGAVAPIATSYMARVGSLPPGLQAKVVDGDQRLWLRASPNVQVVVLDYRGAPYLRFDRAGVAVNQNSEMYYYNLIPVEDPPPNVGPNTAPQWSSVSGGHDYSWHDGRLHALASTAAASTASYVGRWSIPLRLDGHAAAVAGGLWHADDPSIVWFWPIVVLVACMLAARRVKRPDLGLLVARTLALAALAGIATAAWGRELHGRPTVSVFQLIVLVLLLAFVAWALFRVLFRSVGYMTFFAIGVVAVWEGANLIPTLLSGFVLAATPAFLTRTACVISLGCGIGLLATALRVAPDGELEAPEHRGQARERAPAS